MSFSSSGLVGRDFEHVKSTEPTIKDRFPFISDLVFWWYGERVFGTSFSENWLICYIHIDVPIVVKNYTTAIINIYIYYDITFCTICFTLKKSTAYEYSIYCRGHLAIRPRNVNLDFLFQILYILSYNK